MDEQVIHGVRPNRSTDRRRMLRSGRIGRLLDSNTHGTRRLQHDEVWKIPVEEMICHAH